MRIYADAREYMRESGNPTQWGDAYPPREMIESDISSGHGYVCVDNGKVVGVFYFNIERDPTYDTIDGAWLNDIPCGVVHRIARRRGARGVGAYCLEWCFERCGNMKIDTHRDNATMRALLERLGFTYCGVVIVQNDEERVAFQKAGGVLHGRQD
jgi:RimJ/RimL family protein N-acetyltransferase